MGVLSWNSCQKNFTRKRAKLVKTLRQLEREQHVLLQEVKSWRDDLVEGMRILSELGKDCAILVPEKWAHSVSEVEHGDYYSLAMVGSLASGSIHFPHSRGAQDVWMSTLTAVENILIAWKTLGNKSSIVLGVDLNFTLPRRMDIITGDNVCERSNKHPDRLQQII